jgi:phospholipid/cholesterol/gamma-HCH transport system substrate-binding protein
MKKYSQETIVGIFVVLGLVCVGYMTVKLGDVSLLGDDSYSLYAKFDTVSGLRKGNPVEMRGLEIGRVEDFKMDEAQRVAVVELKIQKHIRIYEDGIASIKTSGLIGDKYVSLDPGGIGELLKGGDTILETESPIDLGDAISKYAFGEVK